MTRLYDACVLALEEASARVLATPDARALCDAPEALFAGLHALLLRTAITDGALSPDALSALHESLLATRATLARGPLRLSLAPAPRARQSSGTYYTPDALVVLLLDAALTPLLARCLGARDPSVALLALRVLDPSCGTGVFLRAAADRIAAALCATRRDDSPEAYNHARDEVLSQCLYGVDRDALAVEIARVALAPSPNLRVADALAVPSWSALFPDVFERGGFDLVVGNPPFLNAIDGRAPGSVVASRSLRGTADVAYHFLSLAHALRASDGRVAMIQPRALLSASSAAALRDTLTPHGVAMLYAPDRSNFFPGARVSIAAVVLGASPACRVSLDDDPRTAAFSPLTLRDGDWWRALHPTPASHGAPLSERFEVRASMATGEAYALRSALIDAPDGAHPKLITTGLIDPMRSLWGARECLYLRQKYRHPRIDLARPLPPSLARRASLWRRPKVLVAGLAMRVECFLDATGACAGAVSTWSITHPRDDLDALVALERALCSDAATAALIATLGASRLGEGSITLTREFLETLRV